MDSSSSSPTARSADAAASAARDTETVRVWDLPTRLFHWTLAGLVIFSVISAHIGGDLIVWHFRSGYAVFALLAFRLLWGLLGGRWSRFSHFVYGPGALLRYVRGQAREGDRFDVGHSPLGSLSVFALLLFLGLQVGTGLVADDEIANAGPLVRFVSEAASHQLTSYHRDIGQWTLLSLIALHVLAIVFYRLKHRRDLLGPMLHGDKQLPSGVPAAVDTLATRALAMLLMAACAALVWWVVSLGQQQ